MQVPTSYGSFEKLFAKMGKVADPLAAPTELPPAPKADLVSWAEQATDKHI